MRDEEDTLPSSMHKKTNYIMILSHIFIVLLFSNKYPYPGSGYGYLVCI